MAKPSMQINLLRAHFKAEPQQQERVKEEPQESDPMTPQHQQGAEPKFVKSIEELSNLSTAILNFKRKFDELNSHVEFIRNAIDSKFNQLPQHTIETPIATANITAAAATLTTTKRQSNSDDASPMEAKTEIKTEKPPCPSQSELENICKSTSTRGRGLRRYIVENLSDIAKLREQVPAALKLARNPARLVLDCVGRFFVQGSKAFGANSWLVLVRKASVLILELFLRMIAESAGEVELGIEKAVKQEADASAIKWRKRMIAGGGVCNACELDARGLLLFVACFGIPRVFKHEDVIDLIRVSNLVEIQDVVRQARVLRVRIPDIIEQMMKNKMNLEAVDIVYIFGIETKISPQKILTSFLQNSKEEAKRATDSPISLKEANEKLLADLNSVMKFIEDRNLDPANLLPGWEIKEIIISLEKEIALLNKKIEDKANSKRKSDQNECSNLSKSREMKRSCFTANGSPLYSSTAGLQEQKAVSHSDGRSLYDSAALSAPYGSSGRLPENFISTRGAIDMHTAGLGPAASNGCGVTTASSYTKVYGDVFDKAGQTMNSNATVSGRVGIVDPAFNYRSVGQSYIGKLPSIEGFPGLPNSQPAGMANQSSSYDLYRFADTVLEAELYNGNSSGKTRPVPPDLSVDHPSYMY